MSILCVGMLCADVIATPVNYLNLSEDTIHVERIQVKNGGDCMNVAVGLGALGAKVKLCGKVGNDMFGKYLLDVLNSSGVDTGSVVRLQDTPTGSCIALINKDGQRMFLYCGGANDTLSDADVTDEMLEGCQYVHISGLNQLPAVDGEGCARLLKRAQAHGNKMTADVTWDSRGRWLDIAEPYLPYLDVFLPSEAEAAMMTSRDSPEKMADFLLGKGVKTVVIKLGAKGCYVKSSDEAFYMPAFEAKVVDTTGAGDAFVAGFLCRYSLGRPLCECARYASATAAYCITKVGATSAAPTLVQVETLIAEPDILAR